MTAALISTCVFAVTVLTARAQAPMSIVGEGLLSKPFSINGQPGKGMRYAGPVVYSNEKPPIIFFPPPPKDAKPGLGGLFGKNKSPKSIKYVPMPHHDLPVLIYTSEKMPPIHVVQPPQSSSPAQFGPPIREEFRPPSGSLSSTYRGILPEATSSRIVTSSFEIPTTSYGTPVKAFGSSLGSLDLSSSGSSSTDVDINARQPEFASGQSLGLTPPHIQHAGSYKKTPPHILYGGHPPVHVFNEPNMFVQAPREIPLKTYADMPPKASFGPPKSFGPPSANSFAAPHSHHYRPHLASLRPPSYPRPSSYFLSRENLISSASSHTPSAIQPSPSNTPKGETKTPVSPSSSYETDQSLGRPPTYSFNPPQTMFSFGPFSIEYGPPSEPFMTYSEPTGSLSSFYGAMNEDVRSSFSSINENEMEPFKDEGWVPGPGPLPENAEEQIKDEVWDAPMPPPLPPAHQPHLRPTPSFHGPRPNPMHNSVLLPSGPHGSLFGGSKLAQFLSAFKLKRSKPKYAIAPKSMHKPPIIIYYGKKPPIHVYQKPADEEYGSQASASSTSAVTFTSANSPSSVAQTIRNDNNGNSKESTQSSSIENIELTFGGSQNSEVRVAAPLSPSAQPSGRDEKPAIIAAKPVDISFSPSELQPSIYKARNSLNTILVSELGGSGANTVKTYIMRSGEDSLFSTSSNDNNRDKSIPIAQNRISGEAVADQIPDASVPISQQDEQVENDSDGDNRGNDDNAPTIVYAIGSPTKETSEEEIQPQASEPAVTVIQSPSSFQTSLSQAEKEAEEAVEVSSS